MDRKSSLIKNTAIMTVGSICTKGIMFILTPLYTLWLSTNEYGTFDLYTTYVSLLIPLITLSSGEAVFRFIIKDSSNSKKVVSTALAIDTIGIIVTIIFFLLFYKNSNLTILTAISLIIFFVSDVGYDFSMRYLRGIKRLEIYTISNIIFVASLAVFITIFVPVCHWGLMGMFLGYSCSNTFAVLYIFIKSKLFKDISIKAVNGTCVKDIVKYSLPLIPTAVCWWIVNVSDRSLVAIYLGVSFNAIYAVANKLPALCNTIFSMFHLSWQQNAIETLNDEDCAQYYSAVMNTMLKIVGTIAIFILGYNYWFFKLLFSDEYFPGFYQSPILTIAIIFSVLSQFLGGIYIAQMKTKKNGITTVFAAVLNVSLNYVLINQIGLFAASISTVVSYLVLFLIRYFDVRRSIRLKINRESVIVLFFVSCFMAVSFVNNPYVHVVSAILGTSITVTANWKYVKKIILRIVKQ